jgi:hypothetical protein
MAFTERLARFARKSNRDKLSAVMATLRSFDEFAPPGFVPPFVLSGRRKRYLASRPDSDVTFSQFPELADLAKRWVHNNRENNSGDLPRLYALAFNLKQVLAEGIEGNFAELGVYRGNSTAILAYYARLHQRQLYLFDTFRGFEKKDIELGNDQILASQKNEFADSSLHDVRGLVGNENVTYLEGWFPASATPESDGSRFAVVHIDCDLYEPMRAGLAYFYPRLSHGGLLILHDYQNPWWEGIKRAVDEFTDATRERLIIIPDKSGTAMIRKSSDPR